MSSSIRLKKSSVTGNVPTTLEWGEIAINTLDGKVYYKNSGDSQIHSADEVQSMACITSQAVIKGEVVYASGGGGGSGKIQVSKFSASSTFGVDELYSLGIAGNTTTGTSNEAISVYTFGKLHNAVYDDIKQTGEVNSWAVGTVLYISATTTGKLTATSPAAPNLRIPIAMVVAENGIHRTLFVRYEHGYHLNELHDVSTGAASSGDILRYDGSKWVNYSGLSVAGNQPYKNMVINGDFSVDQRNLTSFGSRSSNAVTSAAANYPADKWRFSGSTAATISATRSYGDGPNPNFSYMRFQVTSASTTYTTLSLLNRIEGLNTARLLYGTSGAKKSTLSLYVRSSLTGKFSFSIVNAAGTRSIVFSTTLSVANTWTKVSFSFDGETTGTWLYDTGIGAAIRINIQGDGTGNAPAANTWYSANYLRESDTVQFGGTLNSTLDITGIQWELGETASDYELRPYTQELTLCRRYCHVLDAYSSTGSVYAGMTGVYTSATGGVLYYSLPVEMRIVPALTTPNGISWMGVRSWAPNNNMSQVTAFALVSPGSSPSFCSFSFTAGSSRTTATPAQLETFSATNAFKLVLSADL